MTGRLMAETNTRSTERFRLRHDLAITVYSRKSVFWLCMNLDMRKMPLCMFSRMRLSLFFDAPGGSTTLLFFYFAIDVPSSLPLLHFFWSRRHTKSCSCSNKYSFVRLCDQKVVDEGLSFASIAQPKKAKWHFCMKRKRSSSRWNCKKKRNHFKSLLPVQRFKTFCWWKHIDVSFSACFSKTRSFLFTNSFECRMEWGKICTWSSKY